jgi:hypothetical protein
VTTAGGNGKAQWRMFPEGTFVIVERRRSWRLRLAVASLTALLIFALCAYTIWRLYTVLLGAFS